MSTRLKEKEEKLLQTLEKLAQKAVEGTPIVVEGKKDIAALKALSIDGKMIAAKTGGKFLLDVVSEIERCGAKEIILLLDFDRRGKQLTKKLIYYLEKSGITLNMRFWIELSSLLATEVKDVEGLASYMETLKSKTANS
ncbi:MAG: toprim domain-containing protein [Candidatus Bathyarchaeota archaeon]|nr:toprim domain-containing protein [Candidatus Bathyarchaeota archaeon]